MQGLIQKGSVAEIQKFFFAPTDLANLDIRKLTNSQINRHQHVLNHKNKTALRFLLKSNDEGELDSVDLKLLHGSASSSPASSEDIHQYLTFH